MNNKNRLTQPAMSNINETSPLKYPYVDLGASYLTEREAILEICDSVFKSGRLVQGPALDDLELDLSRYFGGPEVVVVRSGTEALTIALKTLGIGAGDEVITVSNSFFATAGAIVAVGAFPRFVDVNSDLNIDVNLIEQAINNRTKAILPVHLTGRTANMNRINEIARQYNLHVVEDAAQAIGAKYHNQFAGSLGIMGCFSAHPLKNLAAMGDAGFLTVNDSDKVDVTEMRYYRNHGLSNRESQKLWGVNCRLDVLQCKVLSHRLLSLDDQNQKRRELAASYLDGLDNELIGLPEEQPHEYNVYHTFTIKVEQRDTVQHLLKKEGIGTVVHYPKPIHLQPPSRKLGYREGDLPVTEKLGQQILSLPIQPHLSVDDIKFICRKVNTICRSMGTNK